MIYLSPAIVLSETAYASLAHPVFGWRNLVTAGGIVADEEEANYPATNLANADTSSVWKSGDTADQDIVFTISPEDEIDFVGIARHNFGTGSIVVTIYGLTAEPGADEVELAQFSPGDDAPILALFEGDYYTQIRIHLEPDAVEPQAAVVYIGTALVMPRSTPPGFTHLKDGLQRTKVFGIAENGDFLADIITGQRLSTTVNFEKLDGTWFRSNMRPFVQSDEPFFYAWSPALLPNEAGLAKFESTPRAQVSQWRGEVDVSLPIIGLAL